MRAEGAGFTRLSRILSLLVMVIAVMVMAGWACDMSFLKSISPSLEPMKFNTALGFVVCGLGTWHPAGSTIRRLCAVTLIALGALTGIELSFGIDLGIDQLFFHDVVGPGGHAPGRMSPATALNFVLVGVALLTSRVFTGQVLVILSGAMSFLALSGYVYGAKSLYAVGPFVSLAFHTTICFLIATAAYLASRPTEGVMRVLTSDGIAGRLLRRVLPAIVLIPLGLGWLRLRGQDIGYYDTHFGIAILAASSVMLLSLLAWAAAGSLYRSEASRQAAELDAAAREQDLFITLNSIGDAVIATDAAGAITRMNPAAVRLTGWADTEAVGKPLRDIFRIFNEDTREPVESPVDRVLSEGKVVALANHTVLIARDGSEVAIADSGAPIVDAAGTLRGVVLVFRDVGADRAGERALREAEARYRDLYENAPDMYGSIDLKRGLLIDCNRALTENLGFRKDELVGRPYYDLYVDGESLKAVFELIASDESTDVLVKRLEKMGTAPERIAALSATLDGFRGTGQVYDHERALKRKDGTSVAVSLNVVGTSDENGNPISAKAVWRDITARKQTERDQQFLVEIGELQRLAVDVDEVLYRVTERLALHLNMARSFFSEIDQNDQLTIHRDYYRDGASVARVLPIAVYGADKAAEMRAGKLLIHDDTMTDPRTAELYDRMYAPVGVRSSLTVPLMRGGVLMANLTVADDKPHHWEAREIALVAVVAERTWLWVENLRVNAILRQKEATETLRETEERFRLIIESVREYAIFMLDADGNVSTWNVAAERLNQYPAAEILGRHFSTFYTAEDRAKDHPAYELRRAIADGRYEEEGWRVKKDGSRYWASVLITTLRSSDGTLRGFAKVIRDFTERRHAEEELRDNQSRLKASLKEREILLQEVHHRVKNNLQVISSLINMQRRQMQDPSARTALEECKMRVEAIALIHEKLYQARDYGNVPFSEYAKVLAGNIFHATGNSPALVGLVVEIENLNLAVDKAIPCGLILNELITNALKHAFPAERTGTVRVSMSRIDPEHLLLSVGDDGVGIAADYDQAHSRSLGMQLVTTLTEQLGGNLDIVRGEGTIFRMTFPA